MFRILILSLITALLGTVSYAYIPPSDFIVRNWVKTRNGLKPVRIKTVVTAYVDNQPSQTTFKEVLYVTPSSKTLNGYAVDETGKKLYTLNEKISAAASPSALLLNSDAQEVIDSLTGQNIPIRKPKDWVGPAPTPTPVPSPEVKEAVKAAVKAEVKPEDPNPEIESLTRIDQHINRLAWIIGTTDPKDSRSPQIWFEKDTFHPLKLIGIPGSSGDSSKTYEVRFENYHTTNRLPIPRMIKVLDSQGNVLLISEQTEITSVFKPETQLLHSGGHPSEKAGGLTSSGKSASDSMKELIQLYYDIVR